jgi:hypothetical protein
VPTILAGSLNPRSSEPDTVLGAPASQDRHHGCAWKNCSAPSAILLISSGLARLSKRLARASVYRRWPRRMPSFSAFCRNDPTERLVNFAILATGVRAFECARNSFTSDVVYSRRETFFFFLAIISPVLLRSGLLARCSESSIFSISPSSATLHRDVAHPS